LDIWQIVALALVQGITEFLPISSSAHLILVPHLLGWEDQGLAFDVAVHLGTLLAVLSYFRLQLGPLAQDWVHSVVRRRTVGDSRLAWGVILGTVPVGLAALAFEDAIGTTLRSPLVIAWATVGFGLLLWLADARGKRNRSEHTLSWGDVIVIGCAQALALIPGTSRSGITITAGLLLGLERAAAARFSFLLSIPTIVLAGGLQTLALLETGSSVDWAALALGTLLSGISAYLCIYGFIRLIERASLLPFILYRLGLGVFLLWFFAAPSG
jgi:undecaprenyl-diphosphatase